MELTQQQKKKAEKLISVLEKGDVAVMEYLMDLEDKMSKLDEELKKGLDANSRVDMIKIKGEKGDTYTLKDSDKQEIAEIATNLIDREEIKGKDGENYVLTEKDKKDIAKNVVIPPKIIEKITIEKPIITEITKEVLMDGEIEKVVDIVEKDLPKLGDSIRDSLELLQGNNRLDASAIKNLPIPKNNQNNVIAGVRIFDALLNVNTNGKVDGSVPEWDSSTGMWVMGTGGGGVVASPGSLIGKGTAAIVTSYEGSNDDFENNGTGATAGQSFQLSSANEISSVAIYGGRGNSSSGTFKIEIKTDSPTGTVIATTGTLSSTTLSAYTGLPSWNNINLTTSVNLSAGVTYYLVVTSVTGSSNDEIRWSVDNTSPSYTGGSYYNGTTADVGKDRSFRIYGSSTTNEEITLDSTLAINDTILGATGQFDSNVKLNTTGNGIYIKEGTNATMGTATANGTTEVIVNTNKVTANSRIFLTCQIPGGTPSGVYYVSSRSAGTSFGFKSLVADTSTVAWIIIEPA